MADIKTIGILGYESCSEQDTITPLEIFKGAAMVLGRKLNPLNQPGDAVALDVKLAALKPGNVKMQMGTEVAPDTVLDDTTLYDLLYVPGGVGSGPMSEDATMLDAIRRHYEGGKIVASNCSGVGILFRAGILGDSPVTCVSGIARGLRQDGANVPEARKMWIGNPEARLWTATGSYGVNGASVALVAHYFGRDIATAVAMMFDTIGGIGNAIFELEGPEFYLHPELESRFQDFFQPMLLPEPKVGAVA
jgi:transcriptional regulator GlxA family with amidase domain